MEKTEALVWTGLFLASFRDDLRLARRFQDADKVRKIMLNLKIPVADLDVTTLQNFRDGYRIHRGKPIASLVDLEMF